MKYLFVLLSIVVIWFATILLALAAPERYTMQLFLTAQGLTIVLFILGFYKK